MPPPPPTSPLSPPPPLSLPPGGAPFFCVLGEKNFLWPPGLPAATPRHFPAKRQFAVTATNSAAVLLQLNGRPMAPLGPPGTFGRMVYTQKDLRQANGGDSKP